MNPGEGATPPAPDRTVAALRRALHHAEAYLGGLDRRPVGATADLEELRARLGGELGTGGIEPERVIDELVAAVEGGILGSAGGRFFAWVIGGALPAALAADWLTSTWDQNVALHACAPAAAVIEEVAGAWLKDLLGLPPGASFAFTTGCQLAHFTALAAARHAVLAAAGHDVNENGLWGAPPVRVLVSAARHGSIDRAVRALGFGARSVVALETGPDGGIPVLALEKELAQAPGPTILVLDAADLNIAACDAFTALVPLARAAGAWVHVDGAFGLFARVSRSQRHLVEGIELADSWVTDGHKWLNVPFDCGMVFVRDPEVHRAAMTVSASYITADRRARDPIDWNPEWSRRGRGIAVYAALRELGRDGVERLVDRTCTHAEALVDCLSELPGVEVLWRAQLNQGLVRFLDPQPEARGADHDARTDRVVEAINRTGEAFFSATTWRGMRAMRVSVVNWRTSDADVQRAVAAAARVLEERP